jgi:small subunit ribosomal protein S21
MAIVTINQGESIESALRRFKRKVMTEEIIKDAKKHAFFIPPGQMAKLKSALARKRNKKKGRMRTSPPRDYVISICARKALVPPPVLPELTYTHWYLRTEARTSEMIGAMLSWKKVRLG